MCSAFCKLMRNNNAFNFNKRLSSDKVKWHFAFKTNGFSDIFLIFVKKFLFRCDLIIPSCRTCLILYSTLVRCCMLTRWRPHHKKTASFLEDTKTQRTGWNFILFSHSACYFDTCLGTVGTHFGTLVSKPDAVYHSGGSGTSSSFREVLEPGLTRTCGAP